MTDNKSADFTGLIPREQAENAFRDALNLFVGRGRLYSVEQLEKGARIAHRRIECFRSYKLGHPDYRALHFGDMMSIQKFLGPDFTNEWSNLTEQVAVHSEELCDDDMATACAEYLLEYSKARHRSSEAGAELGPREKRALITKRVRLAA